MRALTIFLCAFMCLTVPASAHEMSMAVMDLKEGVDGRFTIRWPGAKPEALEQSYPVFPDHCNFTPPVVECGEKGLVGPLTFEGMGAKVSAAMFRITYASGETQAYTVTVADPVTQVKPNFDGSGWALFSRVFSSYVVIGFEHILLGFDHLLFVLGLVWIVRSRVMLVKTITSFTIAHSITLGAVTFGLVGVPERLVNALIALSIVFIGVEIVKQYRGETSVTIRHPWVVAFGFGLLHGFGFANALLNLGLPDNSLVAALLAFNVGVEIGQIAFVFLVLALGWSFQVLRVYMPARGVLVPAYVTGGLAALWTAQRVAIILTA